MSEKLSEKEQAELDAQIAADAEKQAAADAKKLAKGEKDAAAGLNPDQYAELKALIDSQAAVIADLKGKTIEVKSKAEKLETPKKSVKVGKGSYKFSVPHFYHDGKYVTSEDAALDSDMLESIAAIPGQGILVEQH